MEWFSSKMVRTGNTAFAVGAMAEEKDTLKRQYMVTSGVHRKRRPPFMIGCRNDWDEIAVLSVGGPPLCLLGHQPVFVG